MARVILDTGVLVAAVRGRLDLAAFAEEDDVALPAVALLALLSQWVAQGCAVGIQPFRWYEFRDVVADADFPRGVVDEVMVPPAQ